MNKTNILIKLYYSKQIKNSKSFCEKKLDELIASGYNAVTADISSDLDWPALLLKSIPAVVFFIKNIAVGNIIKYCTTQEICDKVDVIYQRTWDDLELKKRLYKDLLYYIEESSGSHRYERWNEESLKSMDMNYGWTSPSIKNTNKEYIVVNFNSVVFIDRILIRPRIRFDGVESYKSFPKKISFWHVDQNNKETENIHIENIQHDCLYKYFEIKFSEELKCQKIKIILEETIDIDGKTFPSLIHLSFLGYICDSRDQGNGFFHKKSINYNIFNDKFFTKFGVFFDDDISCEVYNLVKDQAVPTCHTSCYKILLILKGSITLVMNENTETMCCKEDVIIIEPQNSFKIIGIEDENRIVVIFNYKKLVSIWEAR